MPPLARDILCGKLFLHFVLIFFLSVCVCVCAFEFVWMKNVCVLKFKCAHVCGRIGMYVCVYNFYSCMYIFVYLFMFMCLCVCVRERESVCVYLIACVCVVGKFTRV